MIKEKSPVRIEFISGGDHEHYINGMGWGACLNATINLYAFCKITNGGRLEFDNNDKILNHFMQHYKPESVKIETHQDYPKEAGLGGSASHAIAIIRAFDRLNGLKRNRYETAMFAYDIERNKLGVDGGYQDQFSTVYRGFNYMIFKPGRVEINNVKVDKEFIKTLESVSLLIHIPRKVTGHSIQKDMRSKSKENLEIMKKKRNLCEKGKDALINRDLNEFIKLVGKDYELRKNESPLIENSSTREIEKIAKENEAEVCKFLGSGGGGCALIFSNDKKRVAESLSDKAKILDFRFVV